VKERHGGVWPERVPVGELLGPPLVVIENGDTHQGSIPQTPSGIIHFDLISRA
jgi:hypothetical protein